MKIIKNIIVKQILTEKSKQRLKEKFENQLMQLQKEIAQLRFEKKKYEKTNKARLSTGHLSQFDKEVKNRNENIQLIQFQLQQLEMVPLGTEMKETEVQGIVEISEGDHWDELTKERMIIIEDGIVKEIR